MKILIFIFAAMAELSQFLLLTTREYEKLVKPYSSRLLTSAQTPHCVALAVMWCHTSQTTAGDLDSYMDYATMTKIISRESVEQHEARRFAYRISVFQVLGCSHDLDASYWSQNLFRAAFCILDK
jgi:hypothetical protein